MAAIFVEMLLDRVPVSPVIGGWCFLCQAHVGRLHLAQYSLVHSATAGSHLVPPLNEGSVLSAGGKEVGPLSSKFTSYPSDGMKASWIPPPSVYPIRGIDDEVDFGQADFK